PVYFAYLAGVALLNTGLHWGMGWHEFAPSLTFTNGLWWRRYNTWVLTHFWSLTGEQQFYLCWPVFLTIFTGRRRMTAIIAVLIVLPLSRMGLIFSGFPFPLGLPFFTDGDFLLFGSLAAVLWPQIKSMLAQRGKSTARRLEIAGLGLVTAIWYL